MKIEAIMECVEARIVGNWVRVVLETSASSEYEVMPDQHLAIVCPSQSVGQVLGKTFRVTMETVSDDA